MAKILIVDDSPTEQHIISKTLQGEGYMIVSAVNGEEGVKKAKETMPDLILMDVVMPGMNGFQATRKITRDPATKNIPVIMVTTKDQATDRAWAMRQGAIDYLVKPVSGTELLKKIAMALS